MKKILVILILTNCLYGCSQTQCPDVDGFKIVFNKHYNKYAVQIIGDDNNKSFLMKDQWGKYRIYGERWDDNTPCLGCADKSKSLFNTKCKAISFVKEYLRKNKEDKWQ